MPPPIQCPRCHGFFTPPPGHSLVAAPLCPGCFRRSIPSSHCDTCLDVLAPGSAGRCGRCQRLSTTERTARRFEAERVIANRARTAPTRIPCPRCGQLFSGPPEGRTDPTVLCPGCTRAVNADIARPLVPLDQRRAACIFCGRVFLLVGAELTHDAPHVCMDCRARQIEAERRDADPLAQPTCARCGARYRRRSDAMHPSFCSACVTAVRQAARRAARRPVNFEALMGEIVRNEAVTASATAMLTALAAEIHALRNDPVGLEALAEQIRAMDATVTQVTADHALDALHYGATTPPRPRSVGHVGVCYRPTECPYCEAIEIEASEAASPPRPPKLPPAPPKPKPKRRIHLED